MSASRQGSATRRHSDKGKSSLQKYYDINSGLIFNEATGDIEELFINHARDGAFEKLSDLLSRRGDTLTSVDHKDKRTGNTALIWAAKRGHTKIAGLLLRYGADITLRNYDGKTALEIGSAIIKQMIFDHIENGEKCEKRLLEAAWIGNHRVVQDILTSNTVVDVDCRNSEGFTPLLLCSRDVYLFESLGSKLVKDYNPLLVMSQLINYKSDTSASDMEGRTALHYAASCKSSQSPKLAKLLVQHGHTELRDKRNLSALHSAVQVGNIDTVEILIQAGAEVNAQGFAGFSALHLAVYSNLENVANMLLQNGANTDITDNDNQTPFHLARTRKMKSLLRSWDDANKTSSNKSTTLRGTTTPRTQPSPTSRQSSAGLNSARSTHSRSEYLPVNTATNLLQRALDAQPDTLKPHITREGTRLLGAPRTFHRPGSREILTPINNVKHSTSHITNVAAPSPRKPVNGIRSHSTSEIIPAPTGHHLKEERSSRVVSVEVLGLSGKESTNGPHSADHVTDSNATRTLIINPRDYSSPTSPLRLAPLNRPPAWESNSPLLSTIAEDDASLIRSVMADSEKLRGPTRPENLEMVNEDSGSALYKSEFTLDDSRIAEHKSTSDSKHPTTTKTAAGSSRKAQASQRLKSVASENADHKQSEIPNTVAAAIMKHTSVTASVQQSIRQAVQEANNFVKEATKNVKPQRGTIVKHNEQYLSEDEAADPANDNNALKKFISEKNKKEVQNTTSFGDVKGMTTSNSSSETKAGDSKMPRLNSKVAPSVKTMKSNLTINKGPTKVIRNIPNNNKTLSSNKGPSSSRSKTALSITAKTDPKLTKQAVNRVAAARKAVFSVSPKPTQQKPPNQQSTKSQPTVPNQSAKQTVTNQSATDNVSTGQSESSNISFSLSTSSKPPAGQSEKSPRILNRSRVPKSSLSSRSSSRASLSDADPGTPKKKPKQSQPQHHSAESQLTMPSVDNYQTISSASPQRINERPHDLQLPSTAVRASQEQVQAALEGERKIRDVEKFYPNPESKNESTIKHNEPYNMNSTYKPLHMLFSSSKVRQSHTTTPPNQRETTTNYEHTTANQANTTYEQTTPQFEGDTTTMPSLTVEQTSTEKSLHAPMQYDGPIIEDLYENYPRPLYEFAAIVAHDLATQKAVPRKNKKKKLVRPTDSRGNSSLKSKRSKSIQISDSNNNKRVKSGKKRKNKKTPESASSPTPGENKAIISGVGWHIETEKTRLELEDRDTDTGNVTGEESDVDISNRINSHRRTYSFHEMSPRQKREELKNLLLLIKNPQLPSPGTAANSLLPETMQAIQEFVNAVPNEHELNKLIGLDHQPIGTVVNNIIDEETYERTVYDSDREDSIPDISEIDLLAPPTDDEGADLLTKDDIEKELPLDIHHTDNSPRKDNRSVSTAMTAIIDEILSTPEPGLSSPQFSPRRHLPNRLVKEIHEKWEEVSHDATSSGTASYNSKTSSDTYTSVYSSHKSETTQSSHDTGVTTDTHDLDTDSSDEESSAPDSSCIESSAPETDSDDQEVNEDGHRKVIFPPRSGASPAPGRRPPLSRESLNSINKNRSNSQRTLSYKSGSLKTQNSVMFSDISSLPLVLPNGAINEEYLTSSLKSEIKSRPNSRTYTSRLGMKRGSIDEGNLTHRSDVSQLSAHILKWKKGNLLGKGAYGKVYCGLTSDGHLIAVKQISLNAHDWEKAEKEYEGIQEEVELLKTLKHDNIVGFLGTSLDDHVVSIFMQFVPGGTIASLLNRFGEFEERVFQRYTLQIVTGVNYLHENGVIHRDIKGANIMLMSNGVIKLIDFGCARRLCLNLSFSQSQVLKSMKGTPYWMAPEVIKETGHGYKSDIWSIGCTVFEMSTTKPPWSDMAPMAAVFAIGADKPIPSLPNSCSSDAKDFVSHCMQRDQNLRFDSAQLLQHPFLSSVNL